MSADSSELLTVREVAAILRLGQSTVYQLIESRRLAAFRFGGAYRIKRDDLDEFMETCRTVSNSSGVAKRVRKAASTWRTFRHLDADRLRQAWENPAPG